MSYRDHRIGAQLLGVERCPHCEVAAPVLTLFHRAGQPLPRADNGPNSYWAVYACTSCGHLISAKGNPEENIDNPTVVDIFPAPWEVSDALPDRAARYLSQARNTMSQPDASVVMSASCVDAMLKDKGLRKGSLNNRINQAVADGLIVQSMADWAHRVRLDANNPRHADEDVPHLSREDADRAFDFAEALAQFLYVIPSRMPEEHAEADE